ncbi:ABC transporter permease [Thalassolituus sp.]|mgnify:CR=1 FL=1|uniref:ABC transporter permease n=1 Tax=Thalassolituus sp. TaxID=2030822 RepID=UPI002A820B31|nr:ABC transporter permease [Thalassolituus sp.]|tara:strand:- start:1504 stop:2253 length:750 start_codon:yes stop_codon:yes gene_type:complete
MLRNRIITWSIWLAILPLWEAMCQVFSVPSYILPPPSDIWHAFIAVDAGRWLEHGWATIRVAMLGFLLSFAISLPLAILMVQIPLLERTLFPILVVIQSTPVVAIAPLLIVILGAGEASRLTITALITFFPLIVSATTGMRATPPEYIDLSRSLGAAEHKRIWQIRLPYAMPYLFSGIKVAVTLAIIGAVVAEFVAAEKGLGYFIQLSTSYFKIPQAFAALFLLALLSLGMYQLVQLIQRLFFRWSLEP